MRAELFWHALCKQHWCRHRRCQHRAKRRAATILHISAGHCAASTGQLPPCAVSARTLHTTCRAATLSVQGIQWLRRYVVCAMADALRCPSPAHDVALAQAESHLRSPAVLVILSAALGKGALSPFLSRCWSSNSAGMMHFLSTGHCRLQAKADYLMVRTMQAPFRTLRGRERERIAARFLRCWGSGPPL